MPNWCKNFLGVTGPADDVKRFQKQAAELPPPPDSKSEWTPEVFSFQSLLPLPAKRRRPTANPNGLGSPQQEWGCRSDAFRSEQVEAWDGGVVYRFATLWNPPTRFFQKVSERWPTLVFTLDYDEPLLAFRGLARAVKGDVQFLHLDL